jgi:hypothetical protein
VARRLAIAVLLLAMAAGTARAGNGFDGIVNSLEREYGAQRTRIPFMGLANAVMQVAKPFGVSGFRFAIFEDLDLYPKEERGFLSLMREGAGESWTPMIQIRSARSGEQTAIFVKKSGRNMMNMLLAVCEPGEATVIQMKVDAKRFAEWIQVPASVGFHMRNPDSDYVADSRRTEPEFEGENMEGY